jgi:hypothetical protein
MAKAEEIALVDSGATENFIDKETMKRLRLGTKELKPPQPVFNVDGTHNKAGTINKTIHLYVTLGDMEQRLQFYVTDLGKDRMILGYPWLKIFNPEIDWGAARMKGRLKVETTTSKVQRTKHNALRLRRIAMEDATPMITSMEELQEHTWNVVQSDKIHTGNTGEQIRKTTIAQQMAERAYDSSKVNTEERIPPKFARHKKVFSEQEAKRFPPKWPWDHQINLTNDAPEQINGKIYPLLQKLTTEVDEWIDNMVDRGFIARSCSKYGVPTFMVAKKDGTHRIVQDFCKLNKYTVKDITPLPDIKQAIEELGDKVLFSKFDVREGYNTIQIVPEDRWKTGFKTHRGLFEFNVMPFGLCNAPGTFARGLGEDVQPMYREFPLNRFKHYMDDCLIATAEGEEELHERMVHCLLEILKKNRIFSNP